MVLVVSLVSTGRRAVVSSVSEGVDGRHAEVSVVSTSLRRRGLCAKKFALRAQNTPNSAFLPLLGEFFRENDAGVRLLGELFRAKGLKCLMLGELRRAQCCRILIPGSCVSCRASAAYDAVRTWIADAIEHVARWQGVDIENPTWE